MLQNALKEWSVAVDALAQGQTLLLLRKGGIREIGNTFRVPHQRVWLYPTYEHQKPGLLKPQWASQVTPVEPGWHPAQITIKAWAHITHVWTVRDQQSVDSLLPFHIWNKQFVTERFQWKPKQPLHVLLMRVYRPIKPEHIDWQSDYGGCRSWLTLKNSLDTHPCISAIDDRTWTNTAQTIHHQINTFEAIPPWQDNAII